MKTCEDAQQWLDAYLDGELDPVHGLEMQRHLEGCAACAQNHQAQRALAAALSASLRYAAPDDLRGRIAEALRAEAGAASASSPPLRVGLRAGWRRFAQAAASVLTPHPAWGRLGALAIGLVLFVAGLTAFWMTTRQGGSAAAHDLIVQEIIDSHIRSLMVNHLADVVSTDRHTVKPWFNGKLDFSPTVADFDAQGFPLVGGRLDYLDEHPFAALVYRRNQHVINLFVRPSFSSVPADSGTETLTRQGYHLRHWTQAGMSYWAVSDLNEAELQQFAALVRRSTPN